MAGLFAHGLRALLSWGALICLGIMMAEIASKESVMSQSIELPDDLAEVLTEEAARRGMSLPEYAVYLLMSARPPLPPVRNGAELVAYWESEGLIGSRPDIADSQVEARRLRGESQSPRY